jgi:hypothetical protein
MSADKAYREQLEKPEPSPVVRPLNISNVISIKNMSSSTIKSYIFEYRFWELEKYKVPNFNSNFPETLILYYKNKKLVRVSGGLMSRNVFPC